MKYLYLPIVLITILACNAKKNLETENKNKEIESDEKRLNSNCPVDGTCTFDVLNNKSLYIKKDAIGAFYPEVIDGGKTILKFEYKRNEIPGTADSGYSEIIYAEVDSNASSLKLQNNKLTTIKLLFGRICFCRGQTGYYPIIDGFVSISKNKYGIRTFELRFTINEVPQIITSISETF